MDLLRQRAGVSKAKSKRRQEEGEEEYEAEERLASQARAQAQTQVAGPSSIVAAGGHINLFEDLERVRWLRNLAPAGVPLVYF